MDVEFELKGEAATAFEQEQRTELFKKLIDDIAESLQERIIKEFDLSMRLSAFVGQHGDMEAIRTITRSLKVEVISMNPVELDAKFTDDLSHWYEGGELPAELAEILQDIIDTAITKWMRDPETAFDVTESLGL